MQKTASVAYTFVLTQPSCVTFVTLEERDKHVEHVLNICDLKNIMQKVLTITMYTEGDISRKESELLPVLLVYCFRCLQMFKEFICNFNFLFILLFYYI